MTEVQIKRLSVFDQVCREYEVNNDNIRGTRIYISHDDQHLYCTIPKAGCTNFKKVLYNYHGVEPPGWVHHNKQLLEIGIETYHHNDKPIKTIQSYYKVAFVRHPWTRLISAYRDKFLGGRGYVYYKRLYKILGWDQCYRLNERYIRKNILPLMEEEDGDGHDGSGWSSEESSTFSSTTETTSYSRSQTDRHCLAQFSDFVDHIIASHLDNKTLDRHWSPQYQACNMCYFKYDFIGKLEYIQQDFAYLNKLIFDGKAMFGEPRTKVQSDEEMVREHFQHLPEPVFLDLFDVYKMDFLLFGYDTMYDQLYPET